MGEDDVTRKSKIGFDPLGLLHPRFPTSIFIDEVPSGVPFGFLDSRFGTNVSNFEKALASGKFTAVRIHYWWDDHSPAKNTKKLLKIFRERTEIFKEIASRFPIVKFRLSPYLEHRKDEKTFKDGVDAIRSVWGDVSIVNSPTSGGWNGNYLGSIKEGHHSRASGKCSSLDGQSLFDLSSNERRAWRARTKDQVFTLSWVWQFNGRKNASDETSPEKRRAWPDRAMMKKIVAQTYK